MSWIHAVVDVPAQNLESVGDFYGRVFGWPLGPAWDGHPELRSFVPPVGAPYLHLQRIDGPARVHVDLESPDPDALVALATDAGAELVGDNDAGADWQTLRSPGGLPFCVLRAGDHHAPPPVSHPDGHRSRMVQVCIDSPPSRHDAEVAFWRSVLQGRWVSSTAPEFAGKWHDDAGSPIQLLFQRLEAPGGDVRAHLDLGTDDVDAEVRRLLALGAADVEPGRGWHVLRDVAGSLFCVTANSPDRAEHRGLG